MATYKLPELGEGLAEGEVVSWRVKEGDAVKADQTMVEVMTDKATVEVPAPASGVVKKLYYKVGQLAKVGGPLIDIEVSGQAAVAAPAEVKKAAAVAQAAAATVSDSKVTSISAAKTSHQERVIASPAVRKMAREMDVDLGAVQGSGDRGRVLRSDLESGATSSSSTGAAYVSSVAPGTLEERTPFVGIRRKISDNLTKSAFTAVHFTHFDEMDMSAIMKLRDESNEYAEKNKLGVRLTYLPFFIKASIAALKKFPILNSTLDEKTNEVVIKHYYHFGISVQTPNGLMVAVVRDCDKKDVFQIAREIKETADRARTGKASMQDLTGSTITITNVGNIGGLYATPIINFPETVILGMYQIKKRAVVEGEDTIVAKPMMYTNITCDHRVVDGALAAGYMRLFCEYMENPARMAFF